MKVKVVLGILLIVPICLCPRAQDELQRNSILNKRINLDMQSTHIISLLRNLGHGQSNVRDPENDEKYPFFIVYEGAANELKLGVEGACEAE